jgi:hypothetical protein
VIKSRRMRWAGLVACMSHIRNVWKVLVGKTVWRPVGRPKLADRILEQILGNIDWMHLAQYSDQWWALVTMIMKFRFPKKAGNFLSS